MDITAMTASVTFFSGLSHHQSEIPFMDKYVQVQNEYVIAAETSQKKRLGMYYWGGDKAAKYSGMGGNADLVGLDFYTRSRFVKLTLPIPQTVEKKVLKIIRI